MRPRLPAKLPQSMPSPPYIKSPQRQDRLERSNLKLSREPWTRPGLPRNSAPSLPRYSPSQNTFPEIFQDPESEMDFLQEIRTRLTPATVQAAIYKPAPSISPGLDLISPGLLRLTWSSLGQQMILYTVTTSIGRGFIPRTGNVR